MENTIFFCNLFASQIAYEPFIQCCIIWCIITIIFWVPLKIRCLFVLICLAGNWGKKLFSFNSKEICARMLHFIHNFHEFSFEFSAICMFSLFVPIYICLCVLCYAKTTTAKFLFACSFVCSIDCLVHSNHIRKYSCWMVNVINVFYVHQIDIQTNKPSILWLNHHYYVARSIFYWG